MILPSIKINEAIVQATNDSEFRDVLRRKYYFKELMKEAESELAKCYTWLRAMVPCIEKEELALRRLNLETHIEFLNREYFRTCNEEDAKLPYTSVETRKALNKLELDFNNNLL